MRAIDADVFKKNLHKSISDAIPQFKSDEFKIIACRIIESVIEELDRQPTIRLDGGGD